VISFASPGDALAYVAGARAETAACARWSMPSSGTDDGHVHFTMRADGATGAPYPGFRVLIIDSWRVAGTPGIVVASQSWVVIGHNVVTVDTVYSYLGRTSAPANRLRTVRGLTDTAVTAIIASLRRG
jgi:hypothetical protein